MYYFIKNCMKKNRVKHCEQQTTKNSHETIKKSSQKLSTSIRQPCTSTKWKHLSQSNLSRPRTTPSIISHPLTPSTVITSTHSTLCTRDIRSNPTARLLSGTRRNGARVQRVNRRGYYYDQAEISGRFRGYFRRKGDKVIAAGIPTIPCADSLPSRDSI